jgi:glycoside/pentoside/hexuronide:cation symporter, GPH family
MKHVDSKDAPLYSKIAWGLGGLSENLANCTILWLVYPIYNIALGLNPMWIGVAIGVSRFLDAITDPMMGNITDNTKSRWGRRRPWMFIGSILMSVFFALIWLIPAGCTGNALFAYLTIMMLLFYLGFTIFIIPYGALGFELVMDYNLRTGLQVYRLIPAVAAGLIMPWLYRLSLADCFKHETLKTEVNGVRYVGTAVAIVILIFSMVPTIFTKERFASKIQEKISLWKAIKQTLTDKPYCMFLVYVFMVFLGVFFVAPLLTYINIYYICEGDKKIAAYIGGLAGTACLIGQTLGMPLIVKLSRYMDKKSLVFFGLTIAIIGYSSSWFLFTPKNPWLQFISIFVSNLGLCACWVMNGSIGADICDFDELKTGKRREGMYSGVSCFIYKFAISITAILTSAILVVVGIKGEVESLSVEAITKLRLMYAIIPIIALIIGILAMIQYPLKKKKVMEVQKQLEERRGVVEISV